MSEEITTYPPIRVLHIMSGFGGGISSFILNKAKEMPSFNITFDVVTYDDCSDAFKQAIEDTGGKIYRLKNPKKAGWSKFKQSFQMALNENHYDLVHCHIDGYRALFYYLLLPSRLKKRFYIHAHQSYVAPLKTMDKLKFNVEQWINRSLTKSFLGCGINAIRGVYGNNIPVQKMMMIPNSIDPERFALDNKHYQQYRKAFREQLGYNVTDFIVVQASRFETVKNHSFTIKLAEFVKEKGLDVKFIFFGKGNLEADIKAEIAARDVGDYIAVKPYASQIESVYAGADVFLLPSFYEGLPTVVVECQAIGLPVVMSNNITNEVDLDLDLVRAVSLDAPYIEWYEAIKEMGAKQPSTTQERIQQLEQNNFTNYTSAVIYAQFVHGERRHYLIKDNK